MFTKDCSQTFFSMYIHKLPSITIDTKQTFQSFRIYWSKKNHPHWYQHFSFLKKSYNCVILSKLTFEQTQADVVSDRDKEGR